MTPDRDISGVPLSNKSSLSRQLLELAAPCFSCGTCSAVCPWGLVKSESTPVRKLIRQAQLGRLPQTSDIWLCTTCKICEVQCPRGVAITKIVNGLREMAWHTNCLPKGLSAVAWSVYFGGNPWQRPPTERMLWAKDLPLKAFDPSDEILLYFGCNACYDKRIQKVARAVIRLLEAGGVRFGVLGEKEPCCGEGMLSLGQKSYAQELIHSNVRTFTEIGVQNIVAISPHCFDMFKNHYSAPSLNWRVWHYTQFLKSLIERGSLAFQGKVPFRVTYHDPCYLGRGNGEYEAPRRILEAIPGVELVEMRNNREQALCCGGGGGRMWMETPSGERFSNLRMREAATTQAEIVATSCPFCISCLEDSAKVCGLPIQVMDVAELAAYAIDPVSFPIKRGPLSDKEEEELEAFYFKGQTGG